MQAPCLPGVSYAGGLHVGPVSQSLSVQVRTWRLIVGLRASQLAHHCRQRATTALPAPRFEQGNGLTRTEDPGHPARCRFRDTAGSSLAVARSSPPQQVVGGSCSGLWQPVRLVHTGFCRHPGRATAPRPEPASPCTGSTCRRDGGGNVIPLPAYRHVPACEGGRSMGLFLEFCLILWVYQPSRGATASSRLGRCAERRELPHHRLPATFPAEILPKASSRCKSKRKIHRPAVWAASEPGQVLARREAAYRRALHSLRAA